MNKKALAKLGNQYARKDKLQTDAQRRTKIREYQAKRKENGVVRLTLEIQLTQRDKINRLASKKGIKVADMIIADYKL